MNLKTAFHKVKLMLGLRGVKLTIDDDDTCNFVMVTSMETLNLLAVE